MTQTVDPVQDPLRAIAAWGLPGAPEIELVQVATRDSGIDGFTNYHYHRDAAARGFGFQSSKALVIDEHLESSSQHRLRLP